MAGIVLEGVSKAYGAVRAVHRIGFGAATGEFLVLAGPSGCGERTPPPEREARLARVEGRSPPGALWWVYVPLARPAHLAYGLASASYRWNKFFWALVITNSANTRPLTVGLAIFGAPESGVDRGVTSGGPVMAVAQLLLALVLFQRRFMRSLMHAGGK